ncbi:MAG: hypothetical protein V5804_17540 [Mucilaginibacter sp.]|uniref:hypothetical protein n=1 Tax=Mucilaginibacter sp. TaxID=1882438 RepID=UPI0034E3B81F
MGTIETEEQYENTLERVYDLIQIDEKTKSEYDELEALSITVEKYKKINYLMPKPNSNL